LGSIDILIDEGIKTTIYSNQSFKVKYLVTNSVYSDSALRGVMSKVAIETINEVLQNDTVSVTDIQSKLRAKIGGDALSIDISGFGPGGKLTAFSVIDNSVRGTIKKRIVALPDGSFSVQDDVVVDFIKHDI
jgi:predicted thioesterase